MDLAVGLLAAFGASNLITLAVIRFGGLARRIERRVLRLGLFRSLLTWVFAAVVFGGSELLPGWNEPFSRGLASAFFGYALNPGLVKVMEIAPLVALLDNIDREIRETSRFEDPWLLRRDARQLARSYSPRCFVELYEHTLATVLEQDEGLARERTADLVLLLDETVPNDRQMAVILRKIKDWGSDGWPREQTVDGFILNTRSHGYRAMWFNRLRRLVRREPRLIERAGDVIA